MHDITKKRVISIVRGYKKLFPQQYEMAAQANRQRADNQKTNWGEVEGSNVLEREELRMPTDLHTVIYGRLTPDEQTELETDKGMLWFKRTFPEWVPNINKE